MWEERIADARIDIEMTRLLCLKAADMMDRAGNKAAQGEIAMIKVAAPRTALKVLDDAIQAHGGAGVSEDFGLARAYAAVRTLRLADGPDEVHRRAIARLRVQEARMSDPPLDEDALGAWLEANVEGFTPPVRTDQVCVGASNPTYKIVAASGEYVLRRKPFGKLLPSAHAVDREYRLLATLHPLAFPVPRPLALCTDASVIGAIFYVMELAKGRPYANGALPEFDPLRGGICTSNWSTRLRICTRSTRSPRTSPTLASRAIISSARLRAGRASIAIRRPIICPRWSG